MHERNDSKPKPIPKRNPKPKTETNPGPRTIHKTKTKTKAKAKANTKTKAKAKTETNNNSKTKPKWNPKPSTKHPPKQAERLQQRRVANLAGDRASEQVAGEEDEGQILQQADLGRYRCYQVNPKEIETNAEKRTSTLNFKSAVQPLTIEFTVRHIQRLQIS
jgi:hypothetical protein